MLNDHICDFGLKCGLFGAFVAGQIQPDPCFSSGHSNWAPEGLLQNRGRLNENYSTLNYPPNSRHNPTYDTLRYGRTGGTRGADALGTVKRCGLHA